MMRIPKVFVFTAIATLQGAFCDQRIEFKYALSFKLPSAQSFVRVWVPYPVDHSFQKVEDVLVETPLPWRVYRENHFGNRILYLDGKPLNRDVRISATYRISRGNSSGLRPNQIKKGSIDDPARYRTPQLQGEIRKVIAQIASHELVGSQSDIDKVRRLYDYVYRIMRYDKTGTGWGQGDPIWACHNKRGNCSDFHSLFNALCHSAGLASRFLMGFPIPENQTAGEIEGYHCWAEAYTKEQGWLPVDISEAKKNSAPDKYFGKIPADRIEFSLGRQISLNPKQKGEPLNYFIFPYIEIDGKKSDIEIMTSFSFRKFTAEGKASSLPGPRGKNDLVDNEIASLRSQ